ncbi:LOW QUALITY PROTEIN: Hypothetical protein PHPALM_17342 [Phytophthora palmivora]|uniref:SWIM-type domain-containing protein n=1 Tax=Phytophthora palmivora TaxID=4796 RepID=A0A2P4XMG0_9STRA|nr:LOW QUALITY PROTEIN: Hypothetical protein PHPALM_17342 [Phytophthora palmivora]
METMEAILEFFKSNNKFGVETFVIDKDFQEWRVLEKCFPQATVLLCQFHTMANWKKVVKRAKYGLNGIQRDEVEYSIKQMMYSTTREAFNRARDGLEKFCKGECPNICNKSCPEIFTYFQENWEWCSDMWSNHGHQTIAGLLRNQVNVENHLLTALRKFSTQFRSPDTIPTFLQLVAAQLSNDALAKVSAQWDLFMVNKKEARCLNVGPTQSEWKVVLPGREWCVNDITWSCSCLFFKSRRLPCQHVMMVAKIAHRFEVLPAAVVLTRWSMKETQTLYNEFESCLNPLRQVINMVKARLRRVMAPELVSAPLSNYPSSSFPSPSGVKYVRLQREEQANMVVLSSAEKYARAQALFESVINNLSDLPTVDFYQQMSKWKTIIRRDESGGDKRKTTAAMDRESDLDSYFDQLDYADVMAKTVADQELAMKVESLAGMARERSLSHGKKDR